CLSSLPFLFTGCDAKPKPRQDDAKDSAQDSAPAVADASDAATGDKAASGAVAGTGDETAPLKERARYCFDSVPCGDECLPEGASCEIEAEATACKGEDRPLGEFRKGDRALQGLVRPDVFAFNKAQGDPVDGPFTLEMAFEGAPELADASKGKLFANIETTMGAIRCELFEEQTPLTVANFVGLGRGTRPWFDAKSKAWKTEVYYADILIHRVIDGFMVQMGDH